MEGLLNKMEDEQTRVFGNLQKGYEQMRKREKHDMSFY